MLYRFIFLYTLSIFGSHTNYSSMNSRKMTEKQNMNRRFSVGSEQTCLEQRKRKSYSNEYNGNKRFSVCEEKMWCDGNKVYGRSLNKQHNRWINNGECVVKNIKDQNILCEENKNMQLCENRQKKRAISKYKQKLNIKMKNENNTETKKLNFINTIREISEILLKREQQEFDESDRTYLLFLRDNILNSLLCLNCENQRFMEIRSKVRRTAEILTLYLKLRKIDQQVFCELFSKKDIVNLLEQICTDETAELEILTLTVKTIVNKFQQYHKITKTTCINIIISYIQGQKLSHGIIYIIDILHSFALKDLVDVDESHFIYQFCILPLVTNEIIETITLENFMTISESFFIRDEKMVSNIISFINKEYETGSTNTKIALINLVSSMLSKYVNLESVMKILVRITISAFDGQNYLVLESLCEIYSNDDSYKIIMQYIHTILPSIFDSLFKLSVNYWYEKGKAVVLVIMQKFMRSHNVLFSECLRKYNKKKTLKGVTENYDLEFANIFFNLLSVDEEIGRERRKSVLPFEQDMKGNSFRFEKKRHGG